MSQLPLRSLVAVALVVALGACAPAPPPDTTAADLAAVNAVRDAWIAAYNSGNADAVADLYTEDASDNPANEPSAIGRAAIRERIATQFGMGSASATVTATATEVDGDLAYDAGNYTVSITPAGGGEAMTVDGRYVVILRRQSDGSWKLVRGIDNSPTPLPGMGGGN